MRSVFFGNGGIQIENGGFPEQIEPVGYIVPARGAYRCFLRDSHFIGLQVKLFHEFYHVGLKVGTSLGDVYFHFFEVAFCHFHPSASHAPIEDGNTDAETYQLLVKRVVIHIGKTAVGLRQAELHIQISLKSARSLGIGHRTFALKFLQGKQFHIGTVLAGKFKRFVHRHHKFGYRFAYLHHNFHIIRYSQKTAQILNPVVHFNMGIQAVGLFRKVIDFQLQHLVFGYGAYFVTSFGVSIKGIGIGVIVVCRT
ncbi:hypothetical protein SDC9_60515 [bioreactor metagenome]|uniref:Uncharacterized protein n=1 Tax=bioreactor metagenome TaxID=1076179 RepID=A0A644XD79_9ZZZZ